MPIPGPTTYTADNQINRALRILGVLAEGEIPSTSASADALMALNQMIDSWSTQALSTYTLVDQTFTWPAGQASRSLGPTGDFAGFRPVILDDSTYFIFNNVSYPIQIISNEQYNSIGVKTTTTGYPQAMNLTPTVPNLTMTLWPVPNVNLEFHLMSDALLTQPATLITSLLFPPGYLRAFTYNLALEIAPEFGIEPAKDVRRIAMSSKRDIMRINAPIDTLSMPNSIFPSRGYFNIFTGQ